MNLTYQPVVFLRLFVCCGFAVRVSVNGLQLTLEACDLVWDFAFSGTL